MAHLLEEIDPTTATITGSIFANTQISEDQRKSSGSRSKIPSSKLTGSKPAVKASSANTAEKTLDSPLSATPNLARETIPASEPALEQTIAQGSSASLSRSKNASAASSNATGAWTGGGVKQTSSDSAADATAPHRGTATRPDQTPDLPLDLGVPQQIDGYQIVRELGRGAMGAVYLARQISLDRDVALKTIQAQWAEDPTFIARFTREAYAAAQLTHHNVIQIYDLGQENDLHFFSMEYVRGSSLDELVKAQGKLDPEIAVGYVLQAARGLQFAHLHGMVHRDVKPANLMLNEFGIVKVADLGLVKTPNPPKTDAEVPPEPARPSKLARLKSDSKHQSGHYVEPRQQQEQTTLHINIYVDGVPTTAKVDMADPRAPLQAEVVIPSSKAVSQAFPALADQRTSRAEDEDDYLEVEGTKVLTDQRPSQRSSRMESSTQADQTALNIAMGTPAFMSPEQSENAAGVDLRADIYSLGCTLYVLLTGRTPFSGASAMEVITKHRTEPVVRPDAIVKRIPKELSDIVLKMVAKLPEDRYAHLGEVITSLEHFLGIQAGKPFSPTETHANTLESCLTQFNHAPAVKLRKWLGIAFIAICILTTLVLFPVDAPLAGGVLGILPMSLAAYFVISGAREHTFLFGKVRSLLVSARWKDWLGFGAGTLLLLFLLFVVGWLWYWLALAVFAVGFAMVFSIFVDGRVKEQRKAPLDKMQELLRNLRLKGLEEAALEQFVAKYSFEHWEEFYEALFGYTAKLAARHQYLRQESGKKRSKFRAWREPIIRWIDEKLHEQREAKDRKLLRKLEEKSLQAQGMDLLSARKQAERVTEAVLDEAAEVRIMTVYNTPVVVNPAAIAEQKRLRIKKMLADARAGRYETRRDRNRRTVSAPLRILLVPGVRFWLGCLLLAGFSLWARQNGLFSSEYWRAITDAVKTTIEDRDTWLLEETFEGIGEGKYEPLPIPYIGAIVSSFNAGIAGLMLMLLGVLRGLKLSLFALPAAAIMVFGPLFSLPNAPIGTTMLSLIVGVGIGLLGFFFGRVSPEEKTEE